MGLISQPFNKLGPGETPAGPVIKTIGGAARRLSAQWSGHRFAAVAPCSRLKPPSSLTLNPQQRKVKINTILPKPNKWRLARCARGAAHLAAR